MLKPDGDVSHPEDKWYSLGGHLLGILEAQRPEVQLLEETARFTALIAEEVAKGYGTSQNTPQRRYVRSWTERDVRFMRLERRRDIMTILFEARMVEITLLRKNFSGEIPQELFPLLIDILEQVDEVPACGTATRRAHHRPVMKLIPPLQRMHVESMRLKKMGEEATDRALSLLYGDIHSKVVDELFEKWVMELASKDAVVLLTTPGHVWYPAGWYISHEWELVVCNK